MPKNPTDTIPIAMRPIYEKLVAVTDLVCHERLNDEYSGVVRELAAALARKRPSPLSARRLDIWACAIIYVIGSENYLGEKGADPHMTTRELCAIFGVSESSVYDRARIIRDAVRIRIFDPRWTLPSQRDESPDLWMISANGLIIDARLAPRQIQEEAFRLGLIPYVPAEHPASPRPPKPAPAKPPRPTRLEPDPSLQPGLLPPEPE